MITHLSFINWDLKMSNSSKTMMDNHEVITNIITPYIALISEQASLTEEEKDNSRESAPRVAKAICEMINTKEQMIENLGHILKDSFPVSKSKVNTGTPMILSNSPILSASLCPHHFLPVQYKVFIAIKIPTDGQSSSVYGLSKYNRACVELAKRPVVQEQYTRDIVELFTKGIIGGQVETGTSTVAGCLAIVEGSHGCMTCRGVLSHAPSITVYSDGLTQAEIDNAWSQYHAHKKF